MKKLFVGMGEALWDLLPEGKQIGGAPANFAFHAGQFGFDSIAVSAVGQDALGDEILDVFGRKGLHCMLEQVPFPTGTVQVSLNEAGVPDYEIKEGVAWDNIPCTDKLDVLADRTSVFCFGSLAQRNAVSRATIRYFLGKMPNGEGRFKVFDINLRQHFYDEAMIVASLVACNVLKLNDDEFEILCPMLSLDSHQLSESAFEIIRRYGLRYLILTCGVQGSHVFSEAEHSFCETPGVVVADTVGAGDSFSAAFCAALLAGRTQMTAHNLAVDVAAFVCTQHGAMPEIPDVLKGRLL